MGSENKKDLVIKFACTDRLKETQTLEVNLSVPDTNHKIYNEVLIDKLKEFQFDSNRLLSEFVDKEKTAIAANILTNVKVEKKPQSDGSCSEEEEEIEQEEEDDNEGESINPKNLKKKTKKAKDSTRSLEEPSEKKKCV